MYPIKNMFTGKEIGQFGYENGQYIITGEFPAKEEILNLARNAVAIRGESFADGIRDENVPLDPTTQLDLVANFVNGAMGIKGIRIINYEEEEDMDNENGNEAVDMPTEDNDKALQECVVHKIPIFKREHPDWDEKHVQAAAYGYCKEHKNMVESKDQSFALIKDNDFAGMGTLFHDGTCVLHTKESTELFGSLEKLHSIHAGNVQVIDIAAGVEKTTHEEGHRVDYTEKLRRERQFEPSDCEKDTYKTFEKHGKKFVGCVRKSSGKFEVQSVMTERDQAFTGKEPENQLDDFAWYEDENGQLVPVTDADEEIPEIDFEENKEKEAED